MTTRQLILAHQKSLAIRRIKQGVFPRNRFPVAMRAAAKKART